MGYFGDTILNSNFELSMVSPKYPGLSRVSHLCVLRGDSFSFVIPAKAGIQAGPSARRGAGPWTPAFALGDAHMF